ncbi:hypothetical protein HaLaN_26459, partial [Haematococcus lacustris]
MSMVGMSGVSMGVNPKDNAIGQGRDARGTPLASMKELLMGAMSILQSLGAETRRLRISNKQQIDLKNSTADLHDATPTRYADRPTSGRSTSLVVAALLPSCGAARRSGASRFDLLKFSIRDGTFYRAILPDLVGPDW